MGLDTEVYCVGSGFGVTADVFVYGIGIMLQVPGLGIMDEVRDFV